MDGPRPLQAETGSVMMPRTVRQACRLRESAAAGFGYSRAWPDHSDGREAGRCLDPPSAVLVAGHDYARKGSTSS